MPAKPETRPCKACGVELIFAESRETGKIIPLEAKPLTGTYHRGYDGTAVTVNGVYRSHFTTCPKASEFSKRNKPDGNDAGSESKGGAT